MDLSGQASPAPQHFTNIVYLARVDSTNAYVADAFVEGAQEGLVVIANEQLSGRGRLGRQWYAPAGSSFLCSVLFEPLIGIERFAVISSALALAARAAISKVVGVTCALKWPNDLIIGDKKLAGVLAELIGDPADPKRRGVVVGIGINLSWPSDWPPADASADVREAIARATTLEQASGKRVEWNDLLDPFLVEVEERYRELSTADGLASVMEEYRRACATIGKRVRIERVSDTFEAAAIGVDDHGRLVLDTPTGTMSLDTADVVHLRDEKD